MTADVHDHDTALNSLLSQLARFFRTNETSLSTENCRYSFGRLPNDDQSALKRLFRMLQRKGKSRNGSSGKQLADEQNHPSGNSHSSPEQISPDILHETTSDTDEITTDSSESGEDTVCGEDALLRDTNFSRCVVKPPPSVNDILIRCIENPHHFFTAVSRCSVPNNGGFPGAFCRVYKRQQRADILRIHRRFDLHNLYALAVELGYHTGKKWKWGALNKVPGEILSDNPSLGLTKGEIKEHLMHYVRIGRGYGRWIKHFGDPGYLIALPLNVTETEYTENRYSKCIPAAARKLQKLGIDDVVKNLELSNLGQHITKKLSLGFKTTKPNSRRANKRKEPPNETAATTDDRIGPSTMPVNANQTQRSRDKPSPKRFRLQSDNLGSSAPLGTSPLTARNITLAANIPPADISQILSNDVLSHQQETIGNSSKRAFHGQIRDDRDTQLYNSPSQPASENSHFGDHESDDQNYAQAFFQPFRPPNLDGHGPDDQDYAQAFVQPFRPMLESTQSDGRGLDDQAYAHIFLRPFERTLGPPQFDGYGLDDQNYAQAFFQPFQSTPEPPQLNSHGPDDQNYAQAFLQPFHQPFHLAAENLAPESSSSNINDLHFTTGSLDRCPGHSCSLEARDHPPTTKPTYHQIDAPVVHQPCQLAVNEGLGDQNVARSIMAALAS